MAVKGSTEWTPLYLLIVLAIAAVLLITFVKPMLRQAAVSSDLSTKEVQSVLNSLSLLSVALPLFKRRFV
ncbi:MAG TPA: hypothetical protein VI874_01890 [Candidatus Norongarragalinales archaeon]|nr:hypothetical protein [Candidatus Norongarragalinales archaeon]